MSLKRWCMSVAVVAVMAVFCGTIRAEDPKPDGGRVKQPGKTGPNVRAEKPFMTGTMIDPGLAALKLEGEAKTKAIDALKAWKTKVDEEQAKLNAQRKELQDKIKAEADKDKKKALQDELAKLPKGPTDAEKYKGARDALKGILTDEQLTKIDETAKATLVESGLKAFDSGIENMAKAGVVLTDEQKTKVEAEKTKLKEALGKVEVGAKNMVFGETMKALAAVKKDVLTDEQRAKLAPKKETGKAENGKADAPK